MKEEEAMLRRSARCHIESPICDVKWVIISSKFVLDWKCSSAIEGKDRSKYKKRAEWVNENINLI